MRRKQIIVALIVLVVFSLGVIVGRRSGSSPSTSFSNAFHSSSSDTTGPCVDFREAGARASESKCVTGRVLRVFTSRGGHTFLDFCEDYRKCPFTSVIFSSDKNKFGDLGSLAGKKVELHGSITAYQGRPEIIIHDPDQIKVVP